MDPVSIDINLGKVQGGPFGELHFAQIINADGGHLRVLALDPSGNYRCNLPVSRREGPCRSARNDEASERRDRGREFERIDAEAGAVTAATMPKKYSRPPGKKG
jgi:hypothetical protein